MAQTIGGEPGDKSRKCLKCGEAFDRGDLANYMFVSRPDVVPCVPCMTLHEIRRGGTFASWAVTCAIIAGLWLALFASFRLFYIPATDLISFYWLGGALLGLAFTIYLSRAVLRAHKWRTGTWQISEYQRMDYH